MVPPQPSKEPSVSTKSQTRVGYSGHVFMLISLVLCMHLPPWVIHAVHFPVVCTGDGLTGVSLSVLYLYLLGSLIFRALLYYVLGYNCTQIV